MSDLFEDIQKAEDAPWGGPPNWMLPSEEFYSHLEMLIQGSGNHEVETLASNLFLYVFRYKTALYAISTEGNSWDDDGGYRIYWPSLLKIKEL